MNMPENYNEATEQIIGRFHVFSMNMNFLLSNAMRLYRDIDKPIEQIQDVSQLIPYTPSFPLIEVGGNQLNVVGHVTHEGQKYIFTSEPKFYYCTDSRLEEITHSSQLTPIDRRKNHVKRFFIDFFRENNALSGYDWLIFTRKCITLKKKYRKKNELPHPELGSSHRNNRPKKRKEISFCADFKAKAEDLASTEKLDFSSLVENALREYGQKRGFTFD